MRIVGVFYLLLTLMNLWGLFLDPPFFAENLPEPFASDQLAVRAFTDAWMVFIFELGVLGAMLVYGSRNPAVNKILVLTVVFAEVFRGIVADAIWITRGYAASSYIPFIVIHLLIIITGWLFVRNASPSSSSAV